LCDFALVVQNVRSFLPAASEAPGGFRRTSPCVKRRAQLTLSNRARTLQLTKEVAVLDDNCERLRNEIEAIDVEIAHTRPQMEVAPSPLGSDAPMQGVDETSGRAEVVAELEARRLLLQKELDRDCHAV
jgi:hypothetical protein